MKIQTHKRDQKKIISRVDEWEIKPAEKEKVREFFEAYSSGEVTGRIGKNTPALIEKIAQSLRVALENISAYNLEGVKAFQKDLVIKKKIKSQKGEPFSLKTQIEIMGYLKRFLVWSGKEKITSPLDIKIKVERIEEDYLTLEEIDKMYKACATNEERFVVATLFSSGSRAEEFMNLRYCDFIFPKDDGFIKLRIREGTTKTKPRTISLYYPKCFEAINDYFGEKEHSPEDIIVNRHYNSFKRILNRVGKRALKKRVYPHLLRHSCATWLSSKMNRQQMCIYFGWAFSSNMPDKYINREGVEMADVDKVQKTSNYQELERKIENLSHEKKAFQEDIKNYSKELAHSQVYNSLFAKFFMGEISEEELKEQIQTFQEAKEIVNTPPKK